MSTGLDPVAQKVHSLVDNITNHKEKIIMGIVGVVLFVGALWGYHYYKNTVQISAHNDFINSLKYYDAPVKTSIKDVEAQEIVFDTQQEKWDKVAQVFKQGYDNNRSSTLAPMFRVFYAQALLNNGKTQEALKELQEAVATISVPQLKQAYELQVALIRLDSNDLKDQDRGIEDLKKIAFDQHHTVQGLALYHLGLYDWVNKNFEQAKGYWQQFIVKFGEEKTLDKEVKIVRSKLDLVSV
ncbi:MAG: tetratricopeptide repeat protein [bacterium]